MKNRILIIDSIHDIFYQRAKDKGIAFDIKTNLTKNQLMQIIERYTILVLRGSIKLTHEIIQEGKNLKIIARPGSGLDNIDLEYANSKNILCLNSPEGNSNAVGEYSVGMLLSLCNNFKLAQLNFERKIWDRQACKGIELKNKTIGLVGYGNMGKNFAQKLSSFSVRVIAYDRYLENFSDDFAKETSLQKLHEEADIVSLHIPLNTYTKNFADAHFFDSFTKPIIFLNTSRGEIVKTKDLLEAVNKNKVLFAGLDVLEFESYPAIEQAGWYPKLFAHPRIQITPHIAGMSGESEYSIANILFDKILKSNKL